MAGCAPADEDAHQTAQAIIVANPATYISPSPATANQSETSVAWSAPNMANNIPETTVVGFNDLSASSLMGYGYRILSSGAWTAWTYCNVMVTGPGCNSVVPAVPKGGHLSGDPTVVADGLGHVVYLNIGQSPGASYNDMVLAAVSYNGGQTFETINLVNAVNCNGGDQDQPSAAFDTTVSPPVLYVTWRNNSQIGLGGTYGGCLISGTLNDPSSPGITWSNGGKAYTIDNIQYESTWWGVGSLEVQAGDGVATVVYSSTDDIQACPYGYGSAVHWWSVSTPDGGYSWSDSSRVAGTDSTFAWCEENEGIQNGMRAYAFVRDPAGVYYVVVNARENELTLIRSTDVGMHWAIVGDIPVPDGAKSAFYPAIASDGDGRVGVSFYATNTDDQFIGYYFDGNVNARGPVAPWQGPQLLSSSMLWEADHYYGSNPRVLGDYTWMAAKPVNTCDNTMPTFYPAWADMANSLTTPAVAEADVRLTP